MPLRGEHLAVHPLAHGGDHRIAVDLSNLPGGDGAAGGPSRRVAQLHLLTFQLAVFLLHGCHQLQEPTPSATASSSSSASAGIYFFVRRYTRVEDFAPARRAARAASMAVLPPPTTATWPRGRPFPLSCPEPPITGTTLPGMSSLPAFPRPRRRRCGCSPGPSAPPRRGPRCSASPSSPSNLRRDVVLDGVVTDTEGGDHQPEHAAQLGPLENSDGDTRPAQK